MTLYAAIGFIIVITILKEAVYSVACLIYALRMSSDQVKGTGNLYKGLLFSVISGVGIIVINCIAFRYISIVAN